MPWYVSSPPPSQFENFVHTSESSLTKNPGCLWTQQAIVLLEIAFWKDIKSIVLPKKQSGKDSATEPTRRVVPKDVKNKAKDMCQSQLPHRVGHLFAQAILTCLEFPDLTKGMSEYESQTYFQHNVNSRMRIVTGQV